MQTNTFQKLTEYFSKSNFEASRRFSKEAFYSTKPLKQLLNRLNNPQRAYPTVHIAGTVAKGSVATYLARMLEHDYRVGLYTSPHYESFYERIQVSSADGLKNISEAALSKAWLVIEPFLSRFNISWFDAVTALAFICFQQEQVDYAVIETGLGGGKDSTNNVKPNAVVLTKIGLDHQNVLGNTILEIANEKLGILKPNTPVYSMRQEPEVRERVIQVSAEMNAKYYFYEEKSNDYLSENLGFSIWMFQHHFQKTATEITTALRGRFQKIHVDPPIYFDGGHNECSVRAVLQKMKGLEIKPQIFFNTMKERDIEVVTMPFKEAGLDIFHLPFEDDLFYANQSTNLSVWGESIRECMQHALESKKPTVFMGSIRFFSAISSALTAHVDGSLAQR